MYDYGYKSGYEPEYKDDYGRKGGYVMAKVFTNNRIRLLSMAKFLSTHLS